VGRRSGGRLERQHPQADGEDERNHGSTIRKAG
jgi:hypothetical protein